jgi:hypothetical protein
MGARAKVPAKEGRAEEPAPLSGQTDNREAVDIATTAAPAALPSGAAAGVEFPEQAAANASSDDEAPGAQDPQTLELRPVALVAAHVTRRRAGRQWAQGQIVVIREGELTDEQLDQLRHDSGFTVKGVDEE